MPDVPMTRWYPFETMWSTCVPICSLLIVVSGCAESKPLWITREPVTMISSSDGAFCAIASCGPTAAVRTPNEPNTTRRAAWRRRNLR